MFRSHRSMENDRGDRRSTSPARGLARRRAIAAATPAVALTVAGIDNVDIVRDLSRVADDSVDVHLTVRNFHDLNIPAVSQRFGLDRERILRDLFRTLEPGGILGVVDARTIKEGVDDTAHRINERMVIEQLEQIGFELVDSSDLLAVEGDDYDAPFTPETRWNIDRFVLRFRKPRRRRPVPPVDHRLCAEVDPSAGATLHEHPSARQPRGGVEARRRRSHEETPLGPREGARLRERVLGLPVRQSPVTT